MLEQIDYPVARYKMIVQNWLYGEYYAGEVYLGTGMTQL